MKRLLAFTLALAALVPAVSAQTPSFTGKWEGTFKIQRPDGTEGNPNKVVFNLTQKGKALTGIGGPHTGPGQVWPMSVITRALTSTDPAMLRSSLSMIRGSHGGKGFIHEGVDIDDPAKFTRDWFAWANGLFGELIVHVAATRPEVLRETFS